MPEKRSLKEFCACFLQKTGFEELRLTKSQFIPPGKKNPAVDRPGAKLFCFQGA
jgi:hypothetical protein